MRTSIREIPADRARGGAHVAEDIATQIQDLIVSRKIAEGSRLPSERDLAELLATSRPTVSQAIRILVVRGLVESRRGSGAYVTRRPEHGLAASVMLMLDLDQDSAPQLNDLRLWLEMTGVEQAILKGPDEELAAGADALVRLSDSAGDTAAWMSADTLFHATLVGASQNPFLVSIYESVHSAVVNYEYRTWIQNGTVPSWLTECAAPAVTALHEPILRAVLDRDQQRARDAVLRHHEVMTEHLAAS